MIPLSMLVLWAKSPQIGPGETEDTISLLVFSFPKREFPHVYLAILSFLYIHHTQDKTYMESSLQEAKTNANCMTSTFALSHGVLS